MAIGWHVLGHFKSEIKHTIETIERLQKLDLRKAEYIINLQAFSEKNKYWLPWGLGESNNRTWGEKSFSQWQGYRQVHRQRKENQKTILFHRKQNLSACSNCATVCTQYIFMKRWFLKRSYFRKEYIFVLVKKEAFQLALQYRCINYRICKEKLSICHVTINYTWCITFIKIKM